VHFAANTALIPGGDLGPPLEANPWIGEHYERTMAWGDASPSWYDGAWRYLNTYIIYGNCSQSFELPEPCLNADGRAATSTPKRTPTSARSQPTAATGSSKTQRAARAKNPNAWYPRTRPTPRPALAALLRRRGSVCREPRLPRRVHGRLQPIWSP
jgi:hypothetical protein